MIYIIKKGGSVLDFAQRLKELRKACGITQKAMADKLGLKQNTIATYEIGKLSPSDRTIADICREFNVNENWLRTGEGKMFVQLTENAQFDLVCQELKFSGKHEVIKQILMVYWDLPDDKKDIVDKLVEDIA